MYNNANCYSDVKYNTFWCKTCLNMNTRPRIEFNDEGICNACQWAEEKKNHINWGERENELKTLIEEKKKDGAIYDCIVPVSGGKDGSYVAYMLREEFGLNPLTVTIRPPLELEIGQKERLMQV